jgi:hypothetical protein
VLTSTTAKASRSAVIPSSIRPARRAADQGEGGAVAGKTAVGVRLVGSALNPAER